MKYGKSSFTINYFNILSKEMIFFNIIWKEKISNNLNQVFKFGNLCIIKSNINNYYSSNKNITWKNSKLWAKKPDKAN